MLSQWQRLPELSKGNRKNDGNFSRLAQQFSHFSEDDLWFMAASLFFSPLSRNLCNEERKHTQLSTHTAHT